MQHLRALSFSLSFSLPYPSLLRNSRAERSRRVQYTSEVSKGGGYDDAGKEEVVGKARGRSKLRQSCSRRPERRATQLSERVRLRNPKRKRARRKQSAEIAGCFYLFLFFEISFASVDDRSDLFAALIKHRVRLNTDSIERKKVLETFIRSVRKEEIIPMMDW